MCMMVQKYFPNFVHEELHIFKWSAQWALSLLIPVKIENWLDLSRKTIVEPFESVRELFWSSGNHEQKLNHCERLQWKHTTFTPHDIIQEIEQCFLTKFDDL